MGIVGTLVQSLGTPVEVVESGCRGEPGVSGGLEAKTRC
jgi:hypothetical protein